MRLKWFAIHGPYDRTVFSRIIKWLEFTECIYSRLYRPQFHQLQICTHFRRSLLASSFYVHVKKWKLKEIWHRTGIVAIRQSRPMVIILWCLHNKGTHAHNHRCGFLGTINIYRKINENKENSVWQKRERTRMSQTEHYVHWKDDEPVSVESRA